MTQLACYATDVPVDRPDAARTAPYNYLLTLHRHDKQMAIIPKHVGANVTSQPEFYQEGKAIIYI